MREVFISVKTISKRREQELRFQARCLGAEVQEKEEEQGELSDKQKAAINKAVEEQAALKGLRNVRPNYKNKSR